MYPVLKSSVRLKTFTEYCWIYVPNTSLNSTLPPYAAFILTLLDGRWTVEEIKLIVSTAYNSDERICGELVDKVMQEYAECIDWLQTAKTVQLRYDPQDFLFNGINETNAEYERLETPNILAISITRACNFRCIYCFNASEKQLPGELTGIEWCEVIEQARQLGVLQVFITGGEPTIHSGLPMILRKLKADNIDFKLFTNGGFLTDELCDLLIGSSVQVSLDTADKNLHEKLTGADTFETVVKNIERLVKLNIPVSVKSVITSQNTVGLNELHNLCKKLGAKLLSLEKFDVSSSGRGALDLRLTENQKDDICKMFLDVDNSQTQLNLNLTKDVWTEPADTVGCGAFRNAMIISSDGDFVGCEKMLDVPGMTMGNLRQNTLAELWNLPEIDDFLNNVRNTDDAKCGKCPEFAKCRTGCFALKNYYDKPQFGRDPRCEISV